jgi:hypothetical protein
MTVTDALLENAEAYAAGFESGHLPLPRRAKWPSWPAWTPA